MDATARLAGDASVESVGYNLEPDHFLAEFDASGNELGAEYFCGHNHNSLIVCPFGYTCLWPGIWTFEDALELRRGCYAVCDVLATTCRPDLVCGLARPPATGLGFIRRWRLGEPVPISVCARPLSE